MAILQMIDVGYSYRPGQTVLSNIQYQFKPGNMYAIVGRSGAGKTTLLSILSGLATPTTGSVLYDGKDISKMDRYRYRSRDIGVIFQSYNLLAHLNAAENVELSMDIAGVKRKDKRAYALELLAKVGIDADKALRRVLQLSGGEQQRVAIARSLSYQPTVLLADEPTGNLDGTTQAEIIAIFQRLAHEENKCIILVTHSPSVADAADLVYALGRSGSAA